MKHGGRFETVVRRTTDTHIELKIRTVSSIFVNDANNDVGHLIVPPLLHCGWG